MEFLAFIGLMVIMFSIIGGIFGIIWLITTVVETTEKVKELSKKIN